ncbi:MAG TPA: alpha/beta fold hydrolase [Gemmatimonadota bacterium]|nr:alpha/beta fold hydrolase [Gemmatimonadota bacterium]
MGKRRILRAKGPSMGMATTREVVPREIRAGRYRLFYCESGMGAPLIMVHGLGASSRWWFPLFPGLTSANFRVLAPDLPGFGRSPGPALDIERGARAVVSLADQLGLGQFFLCGHSMGGTVAAQVAADHPGRVRRLALVDSAGIPGTGPFVVLGRLAQPWTWCPPSFYSTLLGDALRAGPGTMLRGMRELRRHDIRPVLRRLRIPTLVIWGERDTLTPPEHAHMMLAELAQGRLEFVAGVRHLPMISDARTTGRLMIDFFKEDLKRRKG